MTYEDCLDVARQADMEYVDIVGLDPAEFQEMERVISDQFKDYMYPSNVELPKDTFVFRGVTFTKVVEC